MEQFNITPDEKLEQYNQYTSSIKEPIIYQGIGIPDIETNFKFDSPTVEPLKTPTSVPTAPAVPEAVEPTPAKKAAVDWSSHFRNNLNENVSNYLDKFAKARAVADIENSTASGEPLSKSGFFNGTVDTKYNGYTGPADLQELKKRLGWAESNHNYGAVYAKTGKKGQVGSGAWGRYQFVWHWSGDDIKKVTGVKDQVAFLKSPEAQEKYFDHYFSTTLKPKLQKFKKEFPKSGLSDTQVMEMMHFQGPDTFIKQFRNGNLDIKIGNNPTVRKRLDANYSEAELNSKPRLKIPLAELSLLSK